MLCIEETQKLQEVLVCCQYYSEHLLASNFRKYQVKAWYHQRKANVLDEVTEAIGDLQAEYDVIFPNMTYEEDIFVCYPIILKNFDITNETDIEKILLSAIQLADTCIDYLVLLYFDENEIIQPQAIKVPKRLFENIDKFVFDEKDSLQKQLMMPYPIEVTQIMLKCFSGTYQVKTQTINEDLSLLADLAEELWVYSKTRELLSEEIDGFYCKKSISDAKKTIEKMLNRTKLNVDSELYAEINEIYLRTCNGYDFNDLEYNGYLTKIQSITQTA